MQCINMRATLISIAALNSLSDVLVYLCVLCRKADAVLTFLGGRLNHFGTYNFPRSKSWA